MTKRTLSIVFLALTAATLVVIPAGSLPLQAGSPAHTQGSQQPASAPGRASGGTAPMPMDMNMDSHSAQPMAPVTSEAKPWCDETAWSTFNHRVAGCYIFLWGLTALIAGLQRPPGTWWRFAPPVVLLGLVQFLFFRNDPEAWPVGPMGFWASMKEPEDMQHRIFLLLLLLIAVVELLRAGDRLPAFFAKYSVALLATLGGAYLLFHQHGGSMAGMSAMGGAEMQQMMVSMNTVLQEHKWFSILGFGVAGTRLLGDARILKGRWAGSLWTVFAIALGAYMTRYVE